MIAAAHRPLIKARDNGAHNYSIEGDRRMAPASGPHFAIEEPRRGRIPEMSSPPHQSLDALWTPPLSTLVRRSFAFISIAIRVANGSEDRDVATAVPGESRRM
jgi:hypothetical protein